jgi:hypothetical protein
MTTTNLPPYSGRRATDSAAHVAAPHEMSHRNALLARRLAILEDLTHPGDGPTGTDAGHKDVDLSPCVGNRQFTRPSSRSSLGSDSS